jgi:hypothetical protein
LKAWTDPNIPDILAPFKVAPIHKTIEKVSFLRGFFTMYKDAPVWLPCFSVLLRSLKLRNSDVFLDGPNTISQNVYQYYIYCVLLNLTSINHLYYIDEMKDNISFMADKLSDDMRKRVELAAKLVSEYWIVDDVTEAISVDLYASKIILSRRYDFTADDLSNFSLLTSEIVSTLPQRVRLASDSLIWRMAKVDYFAL